jgi:hypothetical protein
MDRYSTASAEVIVAAGRKCRSTGIGRPLSFLRTYVLRRFSRWRRGVFARGRQCRGSYYRYMKAWLATRERK